VHLSAANLEL